MRITRIGLGILFAGILASGTGCSESASSSAGKPIPPYVPPADAIVRVHWLGKARLGVTANASYFMRLWLLPLTTKLQAQTLDKLSSAPWRLLAGEAAGTNAAAALLRPLLDDVVWNESYCELRRPAGQAPEFAYAIRLDAAHARLWETNLATVLESLTRTTPERTAPSNHGWSFNQPRSTNRIVLARSGDWTIVTVAPDNHALLAEVRDWIHHDNMPAFGGGTNNWLEAELDLKRFAALLPPAWKLPLDLPKVALTVNGDGGNVLTRAELTFPRPLVVQFSSWNAPTNLVHEPLDSFAAVRGLEPWLSSWKIWNDLHFGTPPDQLFIWAVPGTPAQTFFAAPLANARNQVQNLAEHLMQKGNPWLAARGLVGFQRLPGVEGVQWGNLPSIQPFVQWADAANGSFIFGGLLQNTSPGADTQDDLYERASLARMLSQISAQTNLVYYGWELTGARVQSCLYLAQVWRVISRQAQLPAESVAVKWMQSLVPRLGPCATRLALTGANQLSFTRKSMVGFTGAELQLLSDWLESPQFPRGLYSLLTPPDSAAPGNQSR